MGIIRKFVERVDRTVDTGVEKVVAKEVPPRGEKKPAPPKPTTGGMQRLGERLGFAGIVAATVLAAGAGLVGCKPVAGTPSPATSSCEEDQPCWDCTKDGNKLCGPPATKASCEEPAAWCHRGDAAEAVQRWAT